MHLRGRPLPCRTNSLLFHVDSSTPIIGPLLKTSCSPDEVCLADEVEELREALPGKSLELILRTTSPPVIRLGQGPLLLFASNPRRFGGDQL